MKNDKSLIRGLQDLKPVSNRRNQLKIHEINFTDIHKELFLQFLSMVQIQLQVVLSYALKPALLWKKNSPNKNLWGTKLKKIAILPTFFLIFEPDFNATCNSCRACLML